MIASPRFARGLALLAALGLGSVEAWAQPFEWPLAEGGDGHFYEYVNVPTPSWNVAREAAELRTFRGAAGTLVTIRSAAANEFVRSLYLKMGLSDMRAWIGLMDDARNGDWQWRNGDPTQYTNWAPGEPNNLGTERWVEFFASGVWNNQVETYGGNQGYVVEYVPPVTRCDRGTCYVLHYASRPALTATQAEQVCAAESNGHLASVHSLAENTLIGQMVDPLANGYTAARIGGVAPGGFKSGPDAIYAWTDGTPWNYGNWRPASPGLPLQPDGAGVPGSVVLYPSTAGALAGWDDFAADAVYFQVQHYVCKYKIAPTPPTLVLTRPGPSGTAVTTAARTVTLRGRASDNTKVEKVTWENAAGTRVTAGTATGTELGDPSWLIRNLPLSEGTNQIQVRAWDDEYTPSAPAQIDVLRLPETAVLKALRFNGAPVVTDGQQVLDAPVLAAPGSIEAEVDPRLPFRALYLLLNGEVIGSTTGGPLNATVDVDRLPADQGTPADQPFAYRLTAVLETPTGAILPVRVRKGTQTLAALPFRVDSAAVAVATEDAQSLWTVLPSFASGPLRDVAVDSTGGVWVVAGGEIQVSRVDTTQVVGTEARYVTQLRATAADSALWHWDGAAWTRFTPADIGAPALIFTSVAADAGTVWIGTTQGLLRVGRTAAGVPVVEEVLNGANGLAGSWVSSLYLDGSGRLLVGHRGSHYYRLHPSAQKRYWLDSGGVSVRNGSSWTTYRADKLDDGRWDGVAGFDVTSVAPAGATGFWAGSEAGLSRYDGTWRYENSTTGMTFDDVRALAAATLDEVWAAGPDAANWLHEGTWARYISTPDTFPGGAIHALRLDASRVFFATDGGVASFDPSSRLWTRHPEAGVGVAGGLALAPTGRIWTAVAVGNDGRVAEFNPALGVALLSPATGAMLAVDATGLATAALTWEPTAGATGYEVFLDGAPLGRTVAASRTVVLRPGTHTWTVRALLPGGLAGPKALPRALRVGETRELGDAEVLVLYRAPGGATEVGDVFREPGASAWSAFTVQPGFGASDPASAVDLTASADARLGSATYASRAARPQQYPTPIAPEIPARPSGRPMRLDRTSEPGGLGLLDVGNRRLTLFNDLVGENGQVSGDALIDVAGLSAGRVAFLDHGTSGSALVKVVGRDELRGDPILLAQIALEAGASPKALTAMPDGGFAVLAMVGATSAWEIVVYDASLAPRGPLAVSGLAAAGEPLDLAADEEGRLFLLTTGASGPAVFVTREAAPTWAQVPWSLPAGATNASAIAAYVTPAPRAAPEPMPDGPPAVPFGAITLPGTDVFVYAPNGFASCQSNTAPLWILGFLRTNSPVSCDSAIAPTRLTGTGLFLDYTLAGYGPVPTGAPSGPSARQISPGAFTLDLKTGAITAAVQVGGVSGIGTVTAARLNVLGMGEYRDLTQRKGIGLGEGRSTATYGAFNQALTFSNLFLTDVGGVFHQSFGGIDGLLPPFDKGTLGFSGVPVKLRTTGDLRTTSCAVNFDSVTAEVLASSGVTLPFELSQLCVNPGSVTFGQSSMRFMDLFDFTIQGGSIESAGVGAQSASLQIGVKTFEVTGFHAGTDGFRFASAPGLDLAGIKAEMQQVSLRLPQGNDRGGFSAGLASLNVTNFAGRLDQLDVPFDFFASPPTRFPTAMGGLLRVGTPSDPEFFKVDIQPGLEISASKITIPSFSFVTKKPAFSLSFAGGQITPQYVELNDAPKVPIPAFNTEVDFERIRLGALAPYGTGSGFYTSKAEVTAGPVQVTLRDFSINTAGKLDISGGGFRKAGFGFDVKRNPSAGDALAFRANFSFAPLIQNAAVDVQIHDQSVNLSNFSLTSLTLGPLRVQNPRISTNCSGPLPANDLFFGATVGFGRFPDVTGQLCLKNGAFSYLSMAADFPAPGYPLYGPIYLQHVDGSFDLPRQEMKANALLSGGPKLSFGTFFPGPYYLVTLKGSITISGLGYFQTSAELRMLQGPPGCTGGPPACFGGFLVGQSTAIVGNVYLNNHFVGVGMYFKGNVLLFSGVLNVGMTAWVYPPLGGVLAPGPQQGTFGGDLSGILQVPSSVPLIGGKTFGQTSVSLRGTFPSTPQGTGAASFSGTVNIPLCSPPVYYCTGVKWCQKCGNVPFVGRVCSPPYPCGATGCGWRDACYPVNVGFRIDGSGFHTSRASEAGSLGAPGRGFRMGSGSRKGLTVLTNFKLHETRVPNRTNASRVGVGLLAQSQAPVNVPEGVKQAIVKVDFTNFAGDAHLTLRFPDGRVFTKDNTPVLDAANTGTVPQPGDPFVFYRHEVHIKNPADDSDQDLKEAAFVFRGPFEIQRTELTDADGVPTGEVVETFAPTDVPAGAYEVTIDATADADQAEVKLFLGNQAPRLMRSLVQPLGNDRYHVEWAVDDPDGDMVNVKLHLGADLAMPEFSQQVGAQDGYPSTGPVSSFDIDLQQPEFREQGITAPLQLFLSLDDSFDEPQYVHVGALQPVVSEKAPPQVTGVVVRPREDAVEVYWDPVSWVPPVPNLRLANFGVVVQEQGPAGSVGLPLTTTVSLESGATTEALVKGIQGGRKYRVTVSAVAQETLAQQGPPLCACNPQTPPEPGSTCDQPAVACDTPTDLTVEHTGRASAALLFEAPTGVLNSPPRFLSTPASLALMGKTYSSPIQVEDPDGDSVSVDLCSCRTLETDPPTTSCDAPIVTCDPPTPAGLAVTVNGSSRLLTYTPTPAGLGRHTNALVARDGRGGEAVQRWSLEVANYGQEKASAVFTSDPPRTVYVGDTFSYAIQIIGLPTTIVPQFVMGQGPAGMSVDGASGLVTFIPGPGDTGTHDIVLEVRDSDGGCASCVGESLGTQAFTLEVLANPLGRLGPVLAVTPDRRVVTADTSVVDFEVANTGTGTFSWTASVDPAAPWLTILSGASGNGPGVIQVQAAPNPGELPRVGSVQIDAISGTTPVPASPRRVTVEQAGARLAVLAVSPDHYTTNDALATSFGIAIRNAGSGTLDWSASVVSGIEWLSLEGGFAENNGTGDGVVVVKLAANPAGVARTGTVRIRSRLAQNPLIDIPVSQIPRRFTEEAAGAGLATLGAKPGGLVFCDLNGDGYPDALVNTSDRDVRTRLYLNDGKGRFMDVTATHAAGLLQATAARSVVCGDIDGDGTVDFVRNDRGQIEVYLNRGPGAQPPWSFGGWRQRPNQVIDATPSHPAHGRVWDAKAEGAVADQASGAGLEPSSSNAGGGRDDDHGPRKDPLDATGMALVDEDRNGSLDLLVDDGENGLLIFENDGHGHFGQADHDGLDDDGRRGGYLAVGDYDADGDVDVLSRRRGVDHNLWTNRSGRFSANHSFEAKPSGMAGSAFCDLDGDGDLDVVWAGRTGSEIWLNDRGRFVPTGEPGLSSGVPLDRIPLRGVACGDLDNDGDVDIVFSADSGPGYLFLNETPAGGGSPLRFKQENSGVELAPGARSLALGDYDGDGDLDLLVNVDGGVNQLWRNHTADVVPGAYLAVRARRCLPHGRSHDEIGATVRLFEADGFTPAGPLQEVSGGSGIGSQGPATVLFGLPGGPDKAYVVEVRFLKRSPHHSGSLYLSATVVRKIVVPATLGPYQVVEVKDCEP